MRKNQYLNPTISNVVIIMLGFSILLFSCVQLQSNVPGAMQIGFVKK